MNYFGYLLSAFGLLRFRVPLASQRAGFNGPSVIEPTGR